MLGQLHDLRQSVTKSVWTHNFHKLVDRGGYESGEGEMLPLSNAQYDVYGPDTLKRSR